MSDFLAHPLVILLVGALLSGLLIPAFTRRWQERQKEVELKTELVSELSESIMKMIITIQIVHLSLNNPNRENIDTVALQTKLTDAFEEWEVKSAVIGTKLQAYFPNTSIPVEWTQFSEIVTDFYALEGAGDRESYRHRIQEKLSALLGSAHLPQGRRWQDLKEGILVKKADLIQAILKAKISTIGFSSFL